MPRTTFSPPGPLPVSLSFTQAIVIRRGWRPHPTTQTGRGSASGVERVRRFEQDSTGRFDVYARARGDKRESEFELPLNRFEEHMLNFRFKKLPALSLCLLLLQHSAVFSQTTAAPPGPLKALDAYVEKGLSDWLIPGLAIAVIKDDKVILARGYGVREAGKAERVDEKTLFWVGS